MGAFPGGHTNNGPHVAKAPIHVACTERFKALDGISQPKTGWGFC